MGQLDRVMSSFFRFGLTDRFACSEKAGQMLYGKAPFTVSAQTVLTRRDLPPAMPSAAPFCGASWA